MLLCSHHLPSQYILFLYFSFPFLWLFAQVYILFKCVFFYCFYFPPRWFSCLQPSCPPSEFVWCLCDAPVYTVCPLCPRTYILSLRGYLISMDLCQASLIEAVQSMNVSNLLFYPRQQIIHFKKCKSKSTNLKANTIPGVFNGNISVGWFLHTLKKRHTEII